MSSSESEILFLIITHMEEDGCTFWAQRHSPTINMDLEHVTSRLERVSEIATKAINPVEGGVYGAKFIDGSWYRCRVLFPISKTECLVQYIDFGNCEEKEKAALVNIPIDLQESSLPSMAHRYRLFNLHIDPDNVAKSKKHIETKCSDDFVKAKLISAEKTSPLEVVLYDEEGCSIGHQLIELGLAADGALNRAKKSVKMSSPVISPAQRFKNPLLSSTVESDISADVKKNMHKSQACHVQKKIVESDSSGIDSMQELDSNGGPDGFTQVRKKLIMECENCGVNKEAAERMRLSMIKLRLDLKESEHQVSTLEEQEKYWKKKYLELKEEKIRAESCGAVTKDPTQIDPPDNSKQSQAPVKTVETAKAAFQESPEESQSPRKDLEAKKQMDEDFARASAIVKKVILPTFEFIKKLASSNKTVEDFLKHQQDMKDIVAKIKKYLNDGGNQTEDQFLALISRRNAILQDLKQSIRSTIPLVTSTDDAALREQVLNYTAQLKKTLPDVNTPVENTDTIVTVGDICEVIQIWKIDRENSSGLAGIKQKLLTCLLQQSEKRYQVNNLADQVKETRDQITSFQSQEKTIKEALDEGKSIRRKRQKIRLLVAELKNLEEEEKDVDDSEKESLKEQKMKITEDLSVQRKELQDCFEKKWILLESLANMVENFSPEMQVEHPELGVKDYLEGNAIVMKDMEIDHFDVKNVRIDDNLDVEVLDTQYRDEPIALHKYSPHIVIGKIWSEVLRYVAIYSNIGSPNAAVPLGIFKQKDAVYVMVSTPQCETFPVNDVMKCDESLVNKILKDIAWALKSLHDNGITHGQLSKDAVSVAVKPRIQAFLSTPNFFKKPLSVPLAEDIRQFGLLMKYLIADTSNKKLDVVAEHCLENSSALTMQPILEAF